MSAVEIEACLNSFHTKDEILSSSHELCLHGSYFSTCCRKQRQRNRLGYHLRAHRDQRMAVIFHLCFGCKTTWIKILHFEGGIGYSD
jgi:hypothetical protein